MADGVRGLRGWPVGSLVLVVECDAAVRALIVRTLTRQSLRVVAAESSSEAVEFVELHEEAAGVILGDVGDGMSVAELEQRIAELRPEVEIVLLQGAGPEQAG